MLKDLIIKYKGAFLMMGYRTIQAPGSLYIFNDDVSMRVFTDNELMYCIDFVRYGVPGRDLIKESTIEGLEKSLIDLL